MIIKNIQQVKAFTAGDDTTIREVLHPKNDPVSLTYSLAHATLLPGEKSRPHRLLNSSEVYIILQGQGTAFIDGVSKVLGPEDVLFIPADAEQYIVNTGSEELRFLCIVSPPWKAEEEVVG